MATLLHICGFEEGGYSDGPYGVGAHAYSDIGAADGLTFDSSIKRNGVYSLKTVGGAGLYQWGTTAHNVGSIWFRWNGLSGTGLMVLFYNVSGGFKISSAGVVSAAAGGGSYTNGPTVAADTWHLLEWYWNASANPWVLKWRVNGSAQTDVSHAAAASTLDAVVLRNEDGTGTIWYDDWAMSVTGGDYPLGPIAVEAMIPTGDGTHVNPSYFKDESGVAASSSTYLKVVPMNTASYWYTQTVGASSYLEWTLPNTTRTNPILGVSVSYGIGAWSPFGANDWAIKLHANSTDGTVRSGNNAAPWGAWQGGSTLFLTAPGGASWTPTLVNGATIRFGYGVDVTPEFVIESVVMEVAWDDEPSESNPVEPTYVPGIWISWDGTGN